MGERQAPLGQRDDQHTAALAESTARLALVVIDFFYTWLDLGSSHTLCHTFAINLTRGGQNLVLVVELLGHARTETTRVYTLPTEDDIQAAVDVATIDH